MSAGLVVACPNPIKLLKVTNSDMLFLVHLLLIRLILKTHFQSSTVAKYFYFRHYVIMSAVSPDRAGAPGRHVVIIYMCFPINRLVHVVDLYTCLTYWRGGSNDPILRWLVDKQTRFPRIFKPKSRQTCFKPGEIIRVPRHDAETRAST